MTGSALANDPPILDLPPQRLSKLKVFFLQPGHGLPTRENAFDVISISLLEINGESYRLDFGILPNARLKDSKRRRSGKVRS